jgi:cytochrome c oxidase subunit 6b
MYFKCMKESDGDEDKCAVYARAYRSICPAEWIEKWAEQREAGTWPGKY